MIAATCVFVICAFFLPFCIHLVLTRFIRLLRRPAHRQRAAILSVVIGGLAMAAAYRYVFAQSPAFWRSAYLLLIYSLSGYSYFHFFNMSETSRRIKLMIGHKSERVYTTEMMLEKRLSRLVSIGELRFDGTTYTKGRGILRMPAQVIFFLHRLLFRGALE